MPPLPPPPHLHRPCCHRRRRHRRLEHRRFFPSYHCLEPDDISAEAFARGIFAPDGELASSYKNHIWAHMLGWWHVRDEPKVGAAWPKWPPWWRRIWPPSGCIRRLEAALRTRGERLSASDPTEWLESHRARPTCTFFAASGPTQVLWLFYEDLLRDLRGSVTRIAAWLQVMMPLPLGGSALLVGAHVARIAAWLQLPSDEAALDEACRLSSFAFMSSPENLHPCTPLLGAQTSRFFANALGLRPLTSRFANVLGADP